MYKSSKNSIFGNLTNWLLHTLAFNELIFDALDYFHWRSGGKAGKRYVFGIHLYMIGN